MNVTCQCADAVYVANAELCVYTSCGIEDSLGKSQRNQVNTSMSRTNHVPVTKNITQTMCDAPIRDKTMEYNVVSTVLMTIACLFVLVRLAHRRFFTQTDLGLDDWFIFLALLNCVPSAVINVSMLSYNGLGRDIWTLTPDQITNFALAFWIITLLYFSEVFVLKLSLLFFYLVGSSNTTTVWQ